jgi:hypothetical protein
VELRAQNSTLGIPKLHALLQAGHPDWSVSERRTRKVLQAEGLVLGPPKKQPNTASDTLVPVSKLIDGLDVSKWSKTVEVKYFNRRKGKGLVATQKIVQGEAVWKEDPFILAPEWSVDHSLKIFLSTDCYDGG